MVGVQKWGKFSGVRKVHAVLGEVTHHDFGFRHSDVFMRVGAC